MELRCVHGVIGFCIACTIVATALPFHLDRDDHNHPDPANTEYVGSVSYSVASTSNTMPPGTQLTAMPSFARRTAQYAAALGWYEQSSSTALSLAFSVASTS